MDVRFFGIVIVFQYNLPTIEFPYSIKIVSSDSSHVKRTCQESQEIGPHQMAKFHENGMMSCFPRHLRPCVMWRVQNDYLVCLQATYPVISLFSGIGGLELSLKEPRSESVEACSGFW